jgi:hypothetical protein
MAKLDRAEFDRRCRANHEDPSLPFWIEAWDGLVEYERCLKERNNGKNIRAARTWQTLEKKGLIRSTEDRVLRGQGGGFCTLMKAGKREATDEFVVLKYRQYFSPNAIAEAKKRIDTWNQTHPVGHKS